MEVRGVEQDLIPYVGQLELPKVPVEGWVIDPDVHGLFCGLCNAVQLSDHNGQVVHLCMMTCDMGMVIDRGRSPEMFLVPFPRQRLHKEEENIKRALLWLRYVDDTFLIQKAEYSQQFLQHINCIDPHV